MCRCRPGCRKGEQVPLGVQKGLCVCVYVVCVSRWYAVVRCSGWWWLLASVVPSVCGCWRPLLGVVVAVGVRCSGWRWLLASVVQVCVCVCVCVVCVSRWSAGVRCLVLLGVQEECAGAEQRGPSRCHLGCRRAEQVPLAVQKECAGAAGGAEGVSRCRWGCGRGEQVPLGVQEECAGGAGVAEGVCRCRPGCRRGEQVPLGEQKG